VYQSKRSAAYEAALKVLKKRKLIYPCACSRREIADSAVGGLDGPIYSGTCRKGLLAGRAARADRVITDNTRIELKDVIQGKIVHSLERQVGDFVVKRADGYYAYQLAAVVDDAAQGITDVVRGADLLDSTTRQIYLQQLLGYTTPRYAHLPVAVNVLGEKLSKQTLAAPIDNRELLATLNAALAFLGQDTITDADPKKMADFWKRAIAGWDLARVPRQRTQPAPD
jgi:glutamyl-Q tRNA(Asp) synthetase